jgi:biopolymer transport protein ExbB
MLQVITLAQQMVDSSATNLVSTTPTVTHLWDILKSGGVLMIPLGLLFVLALFFFFERYFAIRNAGRVDENFMLIIRDHLANDNLTAAKSMAKITDNPVARVIEKGLQRIGKPIDAIERSMESIARLEMYNLEKNLSVLSVISRAAPIFGFVGTLAGLMQLFFDINTTGEFVLNTIAGGLYVKLVTSITGLLIGLTSFLAYSFLHTQIDKTANKMEVAAADFLDMIQEPSK